ncbi:cyclase family protein [Streptomyces sp. NPDC050610]|uniref:cyclase family protein n=1 Tax=Streptomyces sp. NPDC050610 TaxID=3157097 RepID=UPI00343C6431
MKIIFPFPCVVIDHTHTFSSDSPGYFAEDSLVLTRTVGSEETEWNDFRLCLSEHFGTHLDAPSHLRRPGASTVDLIPPDRLIGPVVAVDVRDRAAQDDDYRLAVEDLRSWEDDHGRMPTGCVVVMNSGWQDRWVDPAGYCNLREGVRHFPGFSVEAVRWLLEHRDVKGIGVDTLSIDHGPSTDYPVHRLLLGSERWALENLAALDCIIGAEGVMVVAPLKHRGGSGAPARVLTFLPTGGDA